MPLLKGLISNPGLQGLGVPDTVLAGRSRRATFWSSHPWDPTAISTGRSQFGVLRT